MTVGVALKKSENSAGRVTVVEALKPKNMDELTLDNGVTVKRELITPELAEVYLRRNGKNRNISRSSVLGYTRDINMEAWGFTGEAIKFDKTGALIDGQHRLAACIEAKKPFETLVIRGLETEVQLVLDSGRGRSTGDALNLLGYKRYVQLAGSARWLANIKKETVTLREKMTKPQTIAIIEKHQNLIESAHAVQGVFPIMPSLACTIHYIGTYLLDCEEEANDFVNVFKNGIPSYPGDAAIAWRERLLRHKQEKSSMERGQLLRGTIHAWNLSHARADTRSIQIPKSVQIVGLDYNKI